MKVCFYGYAYNELGKWDYTTISKGIPGSEEATVYLTKEFVKAGHEVDVYFDPPEETQSKVHGNWYSLKSYNSDKFYDIFILIKGRFRPKVIKSKLLYIWQHDIFTARDTFIKSITGILVLSNYHVNNYIMEHNHLNHHLKVIGNGIDPEQFSKPNNSTNRFSIGYFSNYCRGLNYILELWPNIIHKYPKATLTIAYGRNMWYQDKDLYMNHIVSMIERYPDSIKEVGMLGHEELADTMRSISIWAYPLWTNTETFCITAIKAQASGMIPITNRIYGLEDTVHPDSYYIESYNVYKIKDEFYSKLCDTINKITLLSEDELTIEREKYRSFALNWTWKRVYHNIMDDVNVKYKS